MDPTTLAGLEHANMVEVMTQFAGNADGALLRRIGGFAVAASGLPFALFNQVIVEGDEGSQEALTAGVGIMRDRGSPFIVNLRVGADDAVAAMALELGLVRMSERPWMPGMAMHPVPIEPSHGDIAGYEIRRARSRISAQRAVEPSTKDSPIGSTRPISMVRGGAILTMATVRRSPCTRQPS